MMENFIVNAWKSKMIKHPFALYHSFPPQSCHFLLDFDNLLIPFAIWILLILVVLIGLVFKQWLISYFTGLFRINEFSKIHFFSIIRVSLGGLLPILVIFVFVKFVLKWYTFDKYQIFIPLIITMFVFRTSIIFLRLMIFSKYRILH